MPTATRTGCIAFQGGGVLGLAHVGAWQVLSRYFRFIGTAGTSAGAIVAAFVASGFDPSHVRDLFLALQWTDYVKAQGLGTLFGRRNGWSDGDQFYKWMQARLASRLPEGSPHVSFARLYKETGIYLAILAADLNDRVARPVIFDVDSEPNSSVAFAVRASISIPGFFVAVTRRDRGQVLVDGGLLRNLPLEPLLPLAHEKRCPLIGVRFNQNADYLDQPDVASVLKRSLNTVLIPGSQPPEEVMTDPNYLDILIDTRGFTSLSFNMSPSDKQQLLHRGAAAAERALLEFEVRHMHGRGDQTTRKYANAKPDLRDVYVSRSWSQPGNAAREKEATFADAICRLLINSQFRLVGDAPDQAKFDEKRIEAIMTDCGGFAAVLPDRGGGKTSSYMIKEIIIARRLGLPCLVVGAPAVDVSKDLPDVNRTMVRIEPQDLALRGPAFDLLGQRLDQFSEDWQDGKPSSYVFLATDFGKEHDRLNGAIENIVEDVTGMQCILGEEVQEHPIQGTILSNIVGAKMVIANLSAESGDEWNVNTCIEAGMARGAGRELHLICKTPRRSPPFMFRDMQVHFYSTVQDMLDEVAQVLAPHRRRILNEELENVST